MVVLEKSVGHRVEREKDGLWRIVFHLPTSTNCWVLEDTDELTLVDAGCVWNSGTILDTIRSLEKATAKPLRRIALTHAHPDHAGAAAELARETGAAVYAHELEIPYLNGSSSLGDISGNTLSHAFHRTAHSLGMLNPPVVEGAQLVRDADQVGSLRVIHTPGHTPGSSSFWSEKHRALFIGDNASNRFNLLSINMSIFTLAWEQLMESFEKYQNYDARLILPGHGRARYSEHASADLLRLARNYQKLMRAF